MKDLIIYTIGCLLWLPVVLALCDSVLLSVFAIAYAVLLWSTPKISTKAKRFWRMWWRENFRIVNSFYK